jgi:glycosyltransferase involved in cell wall biosynthesis
MRLRVAVFSNAYRPTISGVVTSVCLFRQGLMERGQDVHVFTPEVPGYEDSEPYIYRLPVFLDLTNSYDLALALPLKRPMLNTIRGIKPHLIHSQHPVLVGDLAARYAQQLELPLVFTFHTRYKELVRHYVGRSRLHDARPPPLADWAGDVARDVVQNYLDQCAHVIVPSPSIKRILYDEYEIHMPVTTLSTPIDLARFAHPDPEQVRRRHNLRGKRVLLYLGRIAPEKDIDFMIRAFAHVAVQRSDTVLLIVGKGPHVESLQELTENLSLQDRVQFAGSVPYEEVSHYMAAADLFVFTSRAETQGLVLVEAMATGTPVVATHGAGADDVLADSGAGVLVRADERIFANAVLTVLADRGQLESMRRAAREASQRYSIGEATERLLQVYEQAVNGLRSK